MIAKQGLSASLREAKNQVTVKNNNCISSLRSLQPLLCPSQTIQDDQNLSSLVTLRLSVLLKPIPQKLQEPYLPAKKEGRRAFPKELQLFSPPSCKILIGKQGAGGVWGMAKDITLNIRPTEQGRRQTWHFSLSQLKEELVFFLSLKSTDAFLVPAIRSS